MRRTLSFALILAMAATANAQSWRVRTRYNTPGPNPFGWGSSMAFDAARQVCVEFGGRSACRRAVAAERKEALQMAQSTACAELSGGVTQGMQCQRTPPSKAECDP